MKKIFDECCILGKDGRSCNGACARCGWNPEEVFRRKLLIRSGRLELNDRGLWQLRLRKAQ